MTESLYSLAYVSRSALPGTPAETAAEIAAILATARRNNHRLGVTGALLYSDGGFAQVLEGPRSAVEAIYEVIACDPRHTGLTLRHFHPVETRSFAAWDMGYAGDDPARLARPACGMAPYEGSWGFIAMLQDAVLRAERTLLAD